jgi:hypothetical protein
MTDRKWPTRAIPAGRPTVASPRIALLSFERVSRVWAGHDASESRTAKASRSLSNDHSGCSPACVANATF